jgi:hypothetical protein
MTSPNDTIRSQVSDNLIDDLIGIVNEFLIDDEWQSGHRRLDRLRPLDFSCRGHFICPARLSVVDCKSCRVYYKWRNMQPAEARTRTVAFEMQIKIDAWYAAAESDLNAWLLAADRNSALTNNRLVQVSYDNRNV